MRGPLTLSSIVESDCMAIIIPCGTGHNPDSVTISRFLLRFIVYFRTILQSFCANLLVDIIRVWTSIVPHVVGARHEIVDLNKIQGWRCNFGPIYISQNLLFLLINRCLNSLIRGDIPYQFLLPVVLLYLVWPRC